MPHNIAGILYDIYSNNLYESSNRNGQGKSLDEMKRNGVLIRSDGLVTWNVQGIVDTACPLNLDKFPWDQQVGVVAERVIK